MPYSKSKEKRLARKTKWPDLRYSPEGKCKLFYCEEEVPEGWTTRIAPVITVLPTVVYNREELIAELIRREIEIKPTWGSAHMKRIIDGDISSTW